MTLPVKGKFFITEPMPPDSMTVDIEPSPPLPPVTETATDG